MSQGSALTAGSLASTSKHFRISVHTPPETVTHWLSFVSSNMANEMRLRCVGRKARYPSNLAHSGDTPDSMPKTAVPKK